MVNIGSMDDIQNLFNETTSEFIEDSLEAELDDELVTANTTTRAQQQELCTNFGEVDVSILRDRKGKFEPQVLKKNQTSISQDIDVKILFMYAKSMTTGDIESYIQDIYGISVSDSTVCRITEKTLPAAKE